MCHGSCLAFGTENLCTQEVQGKRVLEVGAYDVNGSLRATVVALDPCEYIGVDIQAGPGVDLVCDATALVAQFGEGCFGLVLCTETLEHIQDWQAAISNLKRVCSPGGIILLTTRSRGFPLHEYPDDWWRYEPEDIRAIFADCELLCLERDSLVAGVFAKIRKPADFHEVDLSDYELFAMQDEPVRLE
jgi:SAM-dependent methyltransferase